MAGSEVKVRRYWCGNGMLWGFYRESFYYIHLIGRGGTIYSSMSIVDIRKSAIAGSPNLTSTGTKYGGVEASQHSPPRREESSSVALKHRVLCEKKYDIPDSANDHTVRVKERNHSGS